MKTRKYNRLPFQVEAVQVTKENIAEVAVWCGGVVVEQESKGKTELYIKVKVDRPLNEKHTRAFITDWILLSGTGLKVYTNRAFVNSFRVEEADSEEPVIRNVFENKLVDEEPDDEANAG